jgi:hypothetical protein
MGNNIMRKSELFSRNNFPKEGRWGIPTVRKQNIDLENLELIAYSDTKPNDIRNCHKGVHFFVDDYRFDGIYRHPEKSLAKLSQYKFLLTPDFSTFPEMDMWRQIESVGMNRWCGAYWQSQGLVVIPTISWSLFPSYDFCFAGVEQGSVVAVSTLGCRGCRHGFLAGYHAMYQRISPPAVICFSQPFDEMEGKVIFVDYTASRRGLR